MKILVTGAHFTPAVAVIEELKKYKDIRIVYVGRKTTLEGDNTKSQESKILPTLGVKFIPLISGRLQRTFTIYTIPSLLKIPFGFIQAVYIILKEKPDVILSFGGYVAVPVIFAGWLFSIPIIIHEQTLVTGLANKISSFFADKIALSFNIGNFKKPTIFTGNPIRETVLRPSNNLPSDYQKIFNTAKQKKLPVLLVTGGSQGSHIINTTIEESLGKLSEIACIIHITGDNKFNDFERLEKRQNEFYQVKKWIGEEYGSILSKADLVISRAGINTLTELAFLAKPALVIPIPFQKEQSQNAKYFEEIGLARILPQSKLSGKSLLKEIRYVLNDLNHFNKSAKGYQGINIKDAAKRLALETILLINNKYVL